MSIADDIFSGNLCMQCHVWLLDEGGNLCECGHPVYCRDCWHDLPKRDRESGIGYFDEQTGEVVIGD